MANELTPQEEQEIIKLMGEAQEKSMTQEQFEERIRQAIPDPVKHNQIIAAFRSRSQQLQAGAARPEPAGRRTPPDSEPAGRGPPPDPEPVRPAQDRDREEAQHKSAQEESKRHHDALVRSVIQATPAAGVSIPAKVNIQEAKESAEMHARNAVMGWNGKYSYFLCLIDSRDLVDNPRGDESRFGVATNFVLSPATKEKHWTDLKQRVRLWEEDKYKDGLVIELDMSKPSEKAELKELLSEFADTKEKNPALLESYKLLVFINPFSPSELDAMNASLSRWKEFGMSWDLSGDELAALGLKIRDVEEKATEKVAKTEEKKIDAGEKKVKEAEKKEAQAIPKSMETAKVGWFTKVQQKHLEWMAKELARISDEYRLQFHDKTPNDPDAKSVLDASDGIIPVLKKVAEAHRKKNKDLVPEAAKNWTYFDLKTHIDNIFFVIKSYMEDEHKAINALRKVPDALEVYLTFRTIAFTRQDAMKSFIGKPMATKIKTLHTEQDLDAFLNSLVQRGFLVKTTADHYNLRIPEGSKEQKNAPPAVTVKKAAGAKNAKPPAKASKRGKGR